MALSSAFPLPLQIILKTRTVAQPAEEVQTFAPLTILCEWSPISVYMWQEPLLQCIVNIDIKFQLLLGYTCRGNAIRTAHHINNV